MSSLKYYLAQVERIFNEEQFIFEPHELYEPIDYTLHLGGKRNDFKIKVWLMCALREIEKVVKTVNYFFVFS